MTNFDFISPTKIFFGKNKENEIGKIIKSYNYNKIAFVYGGGSIKRNGLYGKIVNSLNENNVEFIELNGVTANPKLSLVKEFKNKIKNQQIDMILAVGGGSVIDASKLLSHAYFYEGDAFDFITRTVKPEKHLPLGVVLTISAAGSELSSSCVITNDEITPFRKLGFNSDTNRPLFAVMNPENTYSVNKFQTACGIVDIMMHTLERFMNNEDESELADSFAIGLLKTVIKYGRIAMENPTNYEARAELMLASSYSHNGLTSLGKKAFMRVHGMEHILSGVYDQVAHGAGLSILWPAWCYYELDNKNANRKLTILAKELFDVEDAKTGIDKLKEFYKELNMPTSFKDLGFEVDANLLASEYKKYNKVNENDFKPIEIEKVLEFAK